MSARRKHLYDLDLPKPIIQARPPTPHAWHIDTRDGLHEVIVAVTCTLSNGALAFFNTLPNSTDQILVRALAPQKWDDVQLVDTPNSAPVQLGPRNA